MFSVLIYSDLLISTHPKSSDAPSWQEYTYQVCFKISPRVRELSAFIISRLAMSTSACELVLIQVCAVMYCGPDNTVITLTDDYESATASFLDNVEQLLDVGS